MSHQLVDIIDFGSVYIKNLILRHLHEVHGLSDEAKDYIRSKCNHDTNYVVRMVCDEVEKAWMKNSIK